MTKKNYSKNYELNIKEENLLEFSNLEKQDDFPDTVTQEELLDKKIEVEIEKVKLKKDKCEISAGAKNMLKVITFIFPSIINWNSFKKLGL